MTLAFMGIAEARRAHGARSACYLKSLLSDEDTVRLWCPIGTGSGVVSDAAVDPTETRVAVAGAIHTNTAPTAAVDAATSG